MILISLLEIYETIAFWMKDILNISSNRNLLTKPYFSNLNFYKTASNNFNLSILGVMFERKELLKPSQTIFEIYSF